MVTEHLTGKGRTRKILRGPRYHLLVDSGFFFALFNPGDSRHSEALQQSETRQPISLVDSVMLLMLEDKNIRIGAILTFNDRDFTDICYSKGIEQL